MRARRSRPQVLILENKGIICSYVDWSMYGSFRLMPPEPRSGLLTRRRLLRFLAGRWDHRVTTVVGGPGFGKTTLLVQAIAENRLAPRGEDVWLGIEPQDADPDRLASGVATAFSRDSEHEAGHDIGQRPTPEPAQVADAVWRRSPTEACLVLDNVHHLPPDSAGAAWLRDLVAALPANGHVVVASRSEPPFSLARLSLEGAVVRLAEDELRFDRNELADFAAQRGLDSRRFGHTGGWPAMAELVASVGDRFAGEYLWEEVLQPLGSVRRHVLAVTCDLGEADDELASAAVGAPVELAHALDGVPLIARSADGWHRPHGLWLNVPGIGLAEAKRAEARSRAVENLVRRGLFEEAFTLIEGAALWDAAPGMLRAACLQSDRLRPSQLRRWLDASPASVRTSSAGRLAIGLHTAFTTPELAVEPMQKAGVCCRNEGDVDGELTAIAQLGQLAWWRQDHAMLGSLFPRVTELEAEGHPTARGLAAFGRALLADLAGDDDRVLAELDSIQPNALDATWEALASWMRGVVCLYIGRPEEACEIAERLAPSADPAVRSVLDGLRAAALWHLGRADEVLEGLPAVMDALASGGSTYNLHLGKLLAVNSYAHTGDVGHARRWLADAYESPPPLDGLLSVYSAAVEASLQLAEGDEPSAAATVRAALDTYGLDRNLGRAGARLMIPLSYVLVPETRTYLDSQTLRKSLRLPRDLAAMVVAIREGGSPASLQTVELPDLAILRTALHHRFAAELAVGLASSSRPEGRVLLDILGPPGRAVVRELAATQHQQAKPAKALLAAVPAPPPRSVYLAVLGPLTLLRDGPDGEEVVDPQLRRKRVQALLAFLVGHRRTARSAIAAALWPDLDERSAANNLGVTFNHLVRLLEPDRPRGEPAYLLRLSGQSVKLVSGEHLQIDVDEFSGHMAGAARAEADGTPSAALDHYLAALELYRGDLSCEVTGADWLTLDREHCRARFVTAANRAGQLLLGRGDTDRAQAIAQRALDVDPWSEDAYAVLVGAALARRDRSTAHRMLQRCFDALTDLGVQPSDATRQLQRRLQGVAV